jgi:hypothetical protein
VKRRLVDIGDPVLVSERVNRERMSIPDARTWFRYRNDERVALENQAPKVEATVVSQDVVAETTTVHVEVK